MACEFNKEKYKSEVTWNIYSLYGKETNEGIESFSS